MLRHQKVPAGTNTPFRNSHVTPEEWKWHLGEKWCSAEIFPAAGNWTSSITSCERSVPVGLFNPVIYESKSTITLKAHNYFIITRLCPAARWRLLMFVSQRRLRGIRWMFSGLKWMEICSACWIIERGQRRLSAQMSDCSTSRLSSIPSLQWAVVDEIPALSFTNTHTHSGIPAHVYCRSEVWSQ